MASILLKLVSRSGATEGEKLQEQETLEVRETGNTRQPQ